MGDNGYRIRFMLNPDKAEKLGGEEKAIRMLETNVSMLYHADVEISSIEPSMGIYEIELSGISEEDVSGFRKALGRHHTIVE